MTRTMHDWQAIIRRAKRADGTFVLAASDVSAASLSTVRSRRHPDLHQADGLLLAELQNRHVTDDGQVRGDLYCAWQPARI